MAHIKRLVLYNEFTGEDIALSFKPGTNIIVGPKGGGKSTLLVLLFMAYKRSNTMEDSKLAKTTWEILKNFGLEFKKLIYDDGTVIHKEILSTSSESNKEFVTQSDDIKTKINEAEEIEKDKKDFINNLIATQAEPVIKVLDNYFKSFHEVFSTRAKHIDWKVLEEYEIKPKNYFVELKKVIEEGVLFTTKIDVKKTLKSLALLESYILLNIGDERINPYLEVLNELIEIHRKDLKDYIIVETLIKAKLSALKVLDREIQKDRSSETKINKFAQDATGLFTDLGKAIAKNASAFYHIASTRTTIPLKASVPSSYGLEIVIDDEIEIERNEDKIFEILKKVLYSTSKDVTNWTNWLKESIKRDRPIKNTSISTKEAVITMLYEKTDEKIKLIAEGSDYNTMSLGQKTSFGLKYKIKTNDDDVLFLDQPEDNIDSYTIFSNLIPLIMDKQKIINQQAFIVTHNPNFGVLTNPQSITTCDLTEQNEPYKQIFDPTEEVTTREIEKADSPLAHYLEGGKDALSERYNILVKEKKDDGSTI